MSLHELFEQLDPLTFWDMKTLHPLIEVGGHIFSNPTHFKVFLEAPERAIRVFP